MRVAPSAIKQASILNCLFDGPKTVGELAKLTQSSEPSASNIANLLRREGLAHISEYRLIEKKQPVKVFSYGPGEDVPFVSKTEFLMAMKRAVVVVRRDPFTEAFFGEYRHAA